MKILKKARVPDFLKRHNLKLLQDTHLQTHHQLPDVPRSQDPTQPRGFPRLQPGGESVCKDGANVRKQANTDAGTIEDGG